jgi:hypothetical protein
MTWAMRGAPRPIAVPYCEQSVHKGRLIPSALPCCERSAALCCPVGSRSLPAAPVIAQPRGAAPLHDTVAACQHVLQPMMTVPTRMSCRRLVNA